MKSLIIFDFDGVLADSFNTFYPLLRDAMKHAGLSLTPDQYRNLFMGNVHQGIKEFTKDDKKYETAMEFRNSNYDKYYYDKRLKVKLFPEAVKFLKEVSKSYILTVASSGRENNIKNLLEESGVKELFGAILANAETSKEGMLKELLSKFNAEPKKSVLITDTVGDIKVAKKCGLKTIAVTWGFHSEEVLGSAKPDFMAKSFKEIQKILNKN